MPAGGIVWNEDSRRRFAERVAILQREFPTAAERAGAQVARQVLNDANNEFPATPLLTGNLRSSATFELGPQLIGTVVIWVGFNTPYAARIHELEGIVAPRSVNWTTPGTGSKYLEAKLVAHGAEYLRVWSQKTMRLLGM